MDRTRIDIEQIMRELREELMGARRSNIDPDRVLEDIRAELNCESHAPAPAFSESFGMEAMPTASPGTGPAAVGEDNGVVYQMFANEAQYLRATCHVPYYWDFGSGPKAFIKRIIRKLMRCVMLVINDKRNDFSLHTVNAIEDLKAIVEAQRAEINRLKENAAFAGFSIGGHSDELAVHREKIAAHEKELMSHRERLAVNEHDQRRNSDELAIYRERLAVDENYIGDHSDELAAHRTRLADHDRHMKDHSDELEVFRNVEPPFLHRLADRMCGDAEVLKRLNVYLSTTPTVWGDPARLHIAPSAAVAPCLFNTNSGSIRIGDNTFAGSHVSILAGSHDMHLQGFLRRDAELEEGCDITVGNGVWLGSSCVLLGPCEIGDNAVIAAGAVVTPGTRVPANTVYGGIPARQIASLSFPAVQDTGDPHVSMALERSRGMLFINGWSDRQIMSGESWIGHWLVDDEGLVLANRRAWLMRFGLEGGETDPACSLTISGPGGTNRFQLRGRTGMMEIELPISDGQTDRLAFRTDAPHGRLILAFE